MELKLKRLIILLEKETLRAVGRSLTSEFPNLDLDRNDAELPILQPSDSLSDIKHIDNGIPYHNLLVYIAADKYFISRKLKEMAFFRVLGWLRSNAGKVGFVPVLRKLLQTVPAREMKRIRSRRYLVLTFKQNLVRMIALQAGKIIGGKCMEDLFKEFPDLKKAVRKDIMYCWKTEHR